MRRFTLPGQAPWKYPPWASRRAAVVGWIWTHLLRYEAEICQSCGRPVRLVWWADEETWQRVAEVFPVRLSLLCPRCFSRWAWKVGVFVVFHGRPELDLVRDGAYSSSRGRRVSRETA